jgi:hypothetical protein
MVLVLNGSGKKVVGYSTLTPGNASRRADSVVIIGSR